MDSKERFLRRLAEKIIPFCEKFKISASFLTLFRMVFSFGVIFIFFVDYYLGILFYLIYQFVLMLDYVDGTLARRNNTFSKKWVKIDFMFHYLSSFTMFLTITLTYFFKENNLILFIIGLVGSFLLFIFLLKGLRRFHQVKILKKEEPMSRLRALYSWIGIENPFSIFFILIFARMEKIAIILYTFIYICIFVRKLK